MFVKYRYALVLKISLLTTIHYRKDPTVPALGDKML